MENNSRNLYKKIALANQKCVFAAIVLILSIIYATGGNVIISNQWNYYCTAVDTLVYINEYNFDSALHANGIKTWLIFLAPPNEINANC